MAAYDDEDMAVTPGALSDVELRTWAAETFTKLDEGNTASKIMCLEHLGQIPPERVSKELLAIGRNGAQLGTCVAKLRRHPHLDVAASANALTQSWIAALAPDATYGSDPPAGKPSDAGVIQLGSSGSPSSSKKAER